ncbi:hypothetical protein M427DRAFT_280049 [Gonapodya prolifera JEL478]|uniref:FHA domain-containing protein n=1 Tax=Gonapodya prolifera (strain JEL478) TaxID=1344416 RepID=A0A139AYL8_GONPJ|nr:hypothetical protein M427DRAFT_280049 [Gonapodya prolifera JEL478]|eukprot:KXS21852.1 hypothetical protein M427DRAFT_280049 [Gonapodya prolifera JEL478]
MSETSRTYTQEGEEDQDRQLDSMDGEGMELDQESDDGPERSDFIIQRPSLSSLLGDEMESLGDDSRPRAGSLIQLTFSGAPTRTVYPLYQGFNIIGREPPEGEVKLDGPHVTSKHAIIEMTNERFHFVQDLTTTNGTFVYPLSLDSARGGRRPNTSQPRSEPSMGSPSQLDVHATFGPALKIKPSVRGQSNRYQILHGTVVRFADVMCRFEVAPRWRNGWDREIDGLNPVTGINGISEVGAGDEESTPIHSRSGLSPVSSRPIRQPNFIADSQELLNSARTGGRVVFGDVPSPKPSSPGPVSVHTNDVQDKEKGALEENRMAWSQDLVQDGEEVAIPNVEQPLVDNVVEGSSHRPRGGRRAGGSRGRGRGRERSLAPRRSEDPVRGEEGSDTEGEEDAMSSSDVKVVKDNVRQNAGSTPHSPMQPGSPTIQEQLPVQQEDGGAESDVSESLLAPSKPRRPIKATDEAAASVAVDKKSGKRKKQSLVEEEHSKEEETTKSHSEKGKSGANADAESGHESEHSNRGRTLRGRGRGGLRGRGRGKLASHVSVSQGMDITEAEDEIVTGVKEDLSESANAKSTARKALQSKAGNHINVNIEEPDAAEDHEAEVPGSKRKRKSVPSSAAEGSDEKVAADVKVNQNQVSDKRER